MPSICRTVVVLGDGEMQEGSNWEAAMTAGHRKLHNLTAVVDRNRLQQGARVAATNDLEPLDQKAAAFGFAVVEVPLNAVARAALQVGTLVRVEVSSTGGMDASVDSLGYRIFLRSTL